MDFKRNHLFVSRWAIVILIATLSGFLIWGDTAQTFDFEDYSELSELSSSLKDKSPQLTPLALIPQIFEIAKVSLVVTETFSVFPTTQCNSGLRTCPPLRAPPIPSV